ncbi:MAG: hypothetical protein WBO08_09100 [Mycobacterium sp.]
MGTELDFSCNQLYIDQNGKDLPEILDWSWTSPQCTNQQLAFTRQRIGPPTITLETENGRDRHDH